jgi:RNA polymerase sigma-70 factor (ECF subfamily)
MDAPSDRALLDRTRRGEVEAYGEVVRRYQSSVFNVCYRLLGERREAEDLAQETFIRAYQRLNTFDLARPIGPWIRRVAANLCYNHLKRQEFPQMRLDDEWDLVAANPLQNPEAVHDASWQAEVVRSAIVQLPAAYRAVIELRHFQELSYAEIAAELNIPLSQVKSNLFRARKSLANRLSQEELRNPNE